MNHKEHIKTVIKLNLITKPNLCDYSNAHIFVSGPITIDGAGDYDAPN